MADQNPNGTDESSGRTIIPGAYEPGTVIHNRDGAMSGPAYGSDDQPSGPLPIDADTIREREKEGGGAPRRPR